MATKNPISRFNEPVVADGAANVSKKAAFDVHDDPNRACYPRFEMRNRRPTSWLLGFAGSAVVHVCAVAALFLFGRAQSGRWPARRAGGVRRCDRRSPTVDPRVRQLRSAGGRAIAVDITPRRARVGRARGRSRRSRAADDRAQRFRRQAAAGPRARSRGGRRPPARSRLPARSTRRCDRASPTGRPRRSRRARGRRAARRRPRPPGASRSSASATRCAP